MEVDMIHQKSYKGRYWVIETHGYYEKLKLWYTYSKIIMCFAKKEKIYQGVFQFDTGLVRHCYLLLALTYIMDVTVIIK